MTPKGPSCGRRELVGALLGALASAGLAGCGPTTRPRSAHHSRAGEPAPRSHEDLDAISARLADVRRRIDDATQRALFEFQVDRGIIATGNLDGRTAVALGLQAEAGAADGAVLSPEEASLLRRGAQALVGRHRQDLAVSATGRLDARRTYSEGDLELWFALSAFADNASLYEQLVRVSGNAEGSVSAGGALISAARRGDAALQRSRASGQLQSAWASIRAQLTELDPAYR